MQNLKSLALIVAWVALFSCKQAPPAGQDFLSSIPDPKTLNETYVSNPDNLLAEATVADLNTKLRKLDQSGLAHIDVVFANSIGKRVPKDAVHALFNRWKIGNKEKTTDY